MCALLALPGWALTEKILLIIIGVQRSKRGATNGDLCQDESVSSWMSKRELKSLDVVACGETYRRLELRSGTVLRFSPPQTEPETMSDSETVTAEAAQVLELQQKLALAEQAVNEKDLRLKEAVSKLEQVEEKANELEQAKKEAVIDLSEAREALEQAEEKFGAERSELIGRLGELEKSLEECSERARCELEGQGMKMELEKLRELEALRRKFDCEREQHRLERERDATVIAELKRGLEPKKEPLSERKSAREGGDSLTDSSGESTSRVKVGEHETSSEPTGKTGAGDGSHSNKKSVTFSEPEGKGGGHGKEKHSSSDVEGEKGDGCGVRGEGEVSKVETPQAVPGSSVVDSIGAGGLIQSVAKLIKTQTDMMAAQTKAMTAQSLPPLVHFTGEGSLVGDESFDHWHEQFEERSLVAGWSEEQKKYRLKMHLDKTAFQAYRMLPEETKGSYSAMVKALRKRFRPVDIEELRGMEFHQITQESESVEEIGIKLQVLAREAFPNMVGKELDRLLKGRFFQILLPKWQRKLGHPKPDETFEELYGRARTAERHDRQYSESAAGRSDPQHKTSDRTKKASNSSSSGGSGSSSGSNKTDVRKREIQGPGDDVSEGSTERGSSSNLVCYNCRETGHIARHCRKPKQGAEAAGRSRGSSVGSKVLVTMADLSDQQLKDELAQRMLDKEQQMLTEPYSTVKVVSGAVGPNLLFDISVEGVAVAAMVDTGSQATIISRSLLHKVNSQLKSQGKSLARLKLPSMPLYGKGGPSERELDITAQVELTLAADGRKVTVPVFIQPNSEQACLLGTNALFALGVSVSRANGEPLKSCGGPQAQVRLIQAATIPSMKGRIVKACVSDGYFPNEQVLFEPRHEALEPLGLNAQESLVTVSDGIALIPLKNYQGVSVKLDEGTPLGMVQQCEPVCQVLTEPRERPSLSGSQSGGLCAHVKALPNTPERYQRLLEALELPDQLGDDELKQLKELLRESADVFALDDSELGCTDLVRHVIDTGDHSPVRQPPHRTPMVYRDKIEQLVDEMQGRGIIQPSTSPWASPVVLVPKKDGSLRFCVDYRRLNSITKKDVYPLPRIEDIFDTLGGAKFFTSLDLASGYWQVELDEDARTKSAFATYQGLFEFLRMPFGLCNAPATFQRVMQHILAGMEWRHCFVYLDDILVVSRTFEEHIEHLREVFKRLRSAGLRLKPKKCLILRDEVPYLGHVISARGIRPDPSKTDKVQGFPIPHDVTSVRQFIGLASYYRRFVPDFACIAAPLHALTRKDVVFEWSAACQEAFVRLKEILVTAPILAYPRFGPGVEFVLETDASGVGLGAVLSQLQEDGQLHPVAYASRSLDASEKNYGISELETLGLVWAARHFRPYILGHHTTVYTDHSACLSLLQSARPSGKLARWALTIQELDLTIKHRSGQQNSNADALSRNPTPNSNSCEANGATACKAECVSVCVRDVCDNVCVCSGVREPYPQKMPVAVAGVDHVNVCDRKCNSVCQDDECKCNVCAVVCKDSYSCKVQPSLKDIRERQLQDPGLRTYIKYLEDKELPHDEGAARRLVLESKMFEMIDGILHRESPSVPGRWCVVVPPELRSQLLAEAHDSIFAGHFSEFKVYDKLRRLYWWPKMRAEVRRFCRSCLSCASRKGPGRAIRPPLQPIPTKGPFHRVGVDVLKMPLSSSGNKYIIVFMDYLTKWVEAFATSDQRSETIARLLAENIVCRHGVPEELLSDRGTNFLSDLILELCCIVGMKKINTSGYHPQTDGLVEKFNSTILAMLAKCTDGSVAEWDKKLPFLLFAYRSTIQSSTKESPFFLLYGRDPRLPSGSMLDQTRPEYLVDMEDYRAELLVNLKTARELALVNIKEAQQKQKTAYDHHSSSSVYKVGDRVMVYMPKEVSGKDRKLARPFHGPFRVVSLTQTNAEVQLVVRPEDPPLFVAIDRLRKCYTEMTDESWTGRQHRGRRSKHRQTPTPVQSGRQNTVVQRSGPVTRSMTRQLQEESNLQ